MCRGQEARETVPRTVVSAGAIRDQSRRLGADMESWTARAILADGLDQPQPRRAFSPKRPPAATHVERHRGGAGCCLCAE